MKKWGFLIAAALLLAVILFFYVSFNGNFVTKMVAKGKVQDYVEELFEGHNKQLVDSGFDFKDGSYYFLYEIYTGEFRANYSFLIGGPVFLKDSIETYLDFASADGGMEKLFEQEGTKWLEQQLRERAIAFDEVGYSVDIPKGLYNKKMDWHPQVERKLMPWLWFELKDENQTEAEFLQQCEQIQQLMNELNVTYVQAHVSVTREFDNTDGSKEGYAPIYYEGLYSARFTPETKEIKVN